MVTIEIDGKTYQAEAGAMLIQVTDALGITVPRFCYHKKLSVAANCRMCLVEVEKAPKPMPACATPVVDGMKVRTRSQKALIAQKSVMEFLLINHPLDCPICDQGGECELQDLAVGYGKDVSRYQDKKRIVADKNIGPLIATEMTRCIHCTRCVRFGTEIAGIQELGATGRGEHTLIGTYVERTVDSELSGNVIDLCPVGALTNKVYRFSARSWEMQQYQTVAPHDSIGSNIYVHVQRNQIKRIVPKENQAINEVWLADRDRFSYEGLNANDRLLAPLIKKEGVWHTVDWDTALNYAVQGLKSVIEKAGSENIGGLASPTSTLEELYLFQKLLRGIGCHNIDHRLAQIDFSDQDSAPLFPYLGQSIAELEQNQAALVICSHTRKEQPLLNHRLRKAALRGAQIMFVNSVDYEFNFPVAHKIIDATSITYHLAGIAKSLLVFASGDISSEIKTLLETVSPTQEHTQIAEKLKNAENKSVLLGKLAISQTDFAVIRGLTGLIAQLSGAKFGYLGEAGNTAGAWLAGVLPHRAVSGKAVKKGFHAAEILSTPLKSYVLMGVEPELESWLGSAALKNLQSADFVVALTAYRTSVMDSYADVMLPITLYPETSGTYVNVAGEWQSVNAVINPPAEVRPTWKILRVLGNLFHLEKFDYVNSHQVRDEVKNSIDAEVSTEKSWVLPKAIPISTIQESLLHRLSESAMYATDSLVRRASSLQETTDAILSACVHLNSVSASAKGVYGHDNVCVKQNSQSITMPLVVDDRLPDGCALIYTGLREGSNLGSWCGFVDVTPINH